MKIKKYKSLAFTSTKEEKKEKTSNIEDTNPLEGSLPFTLSDFCDMDESFKEKIRNDSAIKKIVINIIKMYKEIKSDYVYNEIKSNLKIILKMLIKMLKKRKLIKIMKVIINMKIIMK